MQKIIFKKTIDLNHNLKELVSISVDDSINYKMETSGMRAIGSIVINGEYKNDTDRQEFSQSIELDILAPFEKITDKREFFIKVEDFDYTTSEGNLALIIQACVYGVKDDEDRVVEAKEADIGEEIENLLREEEILQEEEVVDVIEPVEEVVKEVVPEKPIIRVEPIEVVEEVAKPVAEATKVPLPVSKVMVVEESDDEDDDLGTYYLYIVKDGDTYSSISAHYGVNEGKVMAYNHDRPLSRGTVVIIPYDA